MHPGWTGTCKKQSFRGDGHCLVRANHGLASNEASHEGGESAGQGREAQRGRPWAAADGWPGTVVLSTSGQSTE